MTGLFFACREKMEEEGISQSAISAFESSFNSLVSGASGVIPESTIDVAPTLVDATSISSAPDTSLLDQTVVLKLNGGLGTGMGLDKAKSLLKVKGDDTFLDLTAKQIIKMRQDLGCHVKFMLMNSFSTSEDTLNFFREKYPELATEEGLEMLQNKVPKLDATTFHPATCESSPENEWCPPGHGDLYAALVGSGRLDALLADGMKYMFVSNSDNLGATLDLSILTHFAQSDAPFMMECCVRTENDKKGGHLAVRKSDGQLVLRESAMCADEDEASFQDITKHRFFNTNNLWIRLDKLKEIVDKFGGFIPLPMIKNSKTVDPKDDASQKVVQLETAMGAAIECFPGSTAISVPRTRFAPVKKCNDLLLLRSDAYVITDDFRTVLNPECGGIAPVINLDSKQYKLVNKLEVATARGIPSLVPCKRLTVKGPVLLSSDCTIVGEVSIVNNTRDYKVVPPTVYTDVTIDLTDAPGLADPSKPTNSAFVFVKPHANTAATRDLVKSKLLDAGLIVLSEGEIKGEEIDEKKLIDQHYYAIASKATILSAADIPVPAGKFEEEFGEKWEKVLAEGRACNAMEACKKFDCCPATLDKAWGSAKKVVKFGGGFYCGVVSVNDQPPLYVFNAFFMAMRSKFVGSGTSIYYYEVEWEPSRLSWSDFRGKLLGPTDPAEAPSDSIRGMILSNYKELGLTACPNKGDNGVHASASPFEGLAEKTNWLGRSIEEDAFGKALLEKGLALDLIKEWTVDPRVTLRCGGKGSIFDALEDMDVGDCLDMLAGLYMIHLKTRNDELKDAIAALKFGGLQNSAFVFVKPHANTPATRQLVKSKLTSAGLSILSEGEILGEEIDDKKLIDQHYYAIASKATILSAADIPVPTEKFEEEFGEKWETVLAEGRACNAMEACKKFDCCPATLDKAWASAKKVVKFGGGFYCGLVSVNDQPPLYVFNAFFMAMRSKFVGAGKSIYYYEVKWCPSQLSWSDFRGKLLGPTDPAEAPPDSIRGTILSNYEELGLTSIPNKGDNGVHASASPFEGLAEKANWLGRSVEEDTFGKALMDAGLAVSLIKAWSVDPRVTLPCGGKGSVFDALEDTDAKDCLEMLAKLHVIHLTARNEDLEKGVSSLSAELAELKLDNAHLASVGEKDRVKSVELEGKTATNAEEWKKEKATLLSRHREALEDLTAQHEERLKLERFKMK